MEIVIIDDLEDVGRLGADAISQHVVANPDAVLGLATGSSPMSVYQELGARVARGELSLARCQAFLLDEYVGLPADHPEAYRAVIDREFCDLVDIDPTNVHGLDGTADDLLAECNRFESAIEAAGGIDVQLLGLGRDGHVAFNEPGSSLGSRTRVKTLTTQTRLDNARFFGGDLHAVPRHCLTQGIGTISSARHLVLVALGAAKAEAVHQLVEGPISALWPGSALQMHPHVTVLLDPPAASRLQFGAYYREAYRGKPSWQGF